MGFYKEIFKLKKGMLKMILERLTESLDQAGYKFSVFSIDHLQTAEEEFKSLPENGLIDESFYKNALGFNFDSENIPKSSKSVFIVAMPHYPSKITFTSNQKDIVVVLPPQYAYPALEEKVSNLFKEVLSEKCISINPVRLPLKYLAAMSGLCRIGRNNLCYMRSSGSFLRMTGFVTDLEINNSQWTGLSQLKNCKNCSLCAENCPTKAIDKNRYLIHAQNCLTYFNETADQIPKWVNPQWHNSIVGCMKCQIICPYNRKNKDFIEFNMSFDEVETEKILHREPYENLDQETQKKIYQLGLTEYYDVLPRNLSLLIENNKS